MRVFKVAWNPKFWEDVRKMALATMAYFMVILLMEPNSAVYIMLLVSSILVWLLAIQKLTAIEEYEKSRNQKNGRYRLKVRRCNHVR